MKFLQFHFLLYFYLQFHLCSIVSRDFFLSLFPFSPFFSFAFVVLFFHVLSLFIKQPFSQENKKKTEIFRHLKQEYADDNREEEDYSTYVAEEEDVKQMTIQIKSQLEELMEIVREQIVVSMRQQRKSDEYSKKYCVPKISLS